MMLIAAPIIEQIPVAVSPKRPSRRSRGTEFSEDNVGS
jgi:hypothetical protein